MVFLMGNKGGSWLTSLKKAFRSPKSNHKNANANAFTRHLHQPPTTLHLQNFRLQSAARIIQTVFRAHLARRALIALKGIVKLQALIRGQNVRKQAILTLKCMQTLLRIKARVSSRLSFDLGRPDYGNREYTVEIDSLIKTPSSYAARKSPLRLPKSPQVPSGSTCISAANTPSLRFGRPSPNYMATTESAQARVRSRSAPRQRQSTPERSGSVRKRLSYPEPKFGFGSMRSPSFKGGRSSCYRESFAVSPCSTTDLRRWHI